MPEKFESHRPQARIERLKERTERAELNLRLDALLKNAVENGLIDPPEDRAVIKRLALIKKIGFEDLDRLKASVDGFEAEIETAYALPQSIGTLRTWAVTIKMGNALREKARTFTFDERVVLSVALQDFTNDLFALRTLTDQLDPQEEAAIFKAIGATPAVNTWGFELFFDDIQNSIVEDIRKMSHQLKAILTYREAMQARQ